jgi:hypothetical protein
MYWFLIIPFVYFCFIEIYLSNIIYKHTCAMLYVYKYLVKYVFKTYIIKICNKNLNEI